MASVADQLIERGFAEGLREAAHKVLLRQLTLRFGALPDDLVAQVNAADTTALDRWLDRLITAATLADVFADAP